MATESINKVIAKGIELLEEFNKQLVKAGENATDLASGAEKLHKATSENAKATKKGADTQNELTEAEKEAIKINKQLSTTKAKIENITSEQNKELLRQKQVLSDTTREIKEQIKAEKSQENSINSLRQANKRLRAELDTLSLTREENKDAIRDINRQINENTKLINENSDATRKTRQNVGNYKEDIKEALGEQEAFGTSLNKMIATFSSGAGIVAGVSAVIVGLGKAYASTARGAADLARASDRLNSITQQIGRRIGDAAGESGFFDTVLQGLQNQLLGISSTIESNLVVALREQIRELEIEEIQQEKVKKQQLDRAEQLRQIRDEERNSFKERIAANNELGEIITKRENETIAFQEKRLKILQTLLRLDEGNIELRKEIAQIEFEIADAQEEAQGFRSEQLINETQLLRELREEQQRLNNEKENELLRAELSAKTVTEIQRKEFEERIANLDENIEQEKERLRDLSSFKEQQLQKVADFEKQLEDEKAEKRKEIQEQEKLKAIEFGNSLFDFRIRNLDRELQAAEGNEKKQLEIRQKLARAEKQKSLFNIAINTAEGIVEALPNLVLSGLVAATGLTQAAIVARQPIPQFSKGTNFAPGGLSLVGERGREILKTPSGEIYMANNPALVNLERGTKVLSNRKTEAYLNDNNIVSELRQTRRAIQKMPQPIFLNGSKIAERRGNYWKNYKISKHRLN